MNGKITNLSDEDKKEIRKLKSQIKSLKMFYLTLLVSFISITVIFQIRLSQIQSYYRTTYEQNQEVIRQLDDLNSDLKEQNVVLQNILAEKN